MDQLLDLVNDILDLSQVKAGHPLGREQVIDLVSETEAGCLPYLEQAVTKGLTTNLDLPDSPLSVRLVPQVYHLIVSNLVSNAVKYTPAGSVSLALRQEGAWVVLRVTDTGIGIPSDDVPRLFKEFFRASNARRSHIPGSGLGLAGVKALVDRCGGQLLVESQENEGSSFTVRLPIKMV
jgi:signal transduction histidine kinase